MLSTWVPSLNWTHSSNFALPPISPSRTHSRYIAKLLILTTPTQQGNPPPNLEGILFYNLQTLCTPEPENLRARLSRFEFHFRFHISWTDTFRIVLCAPGTVSSPRSISFGVCKSSVIIFTILSIILSSNNDPAVVTNGNHFCCSPFLYEHLLRFKHLLLNTLPPSIKRRKKNKNKGLEEYCSVATWQSHHFPS